MLKIVFFFSQYYHLQSYSAFLYFLAIVSVSLRNLLSRVSYVNLSSAGIFHWSSVSLSLKSRNYQKSDIQLSDSWSISSVSKREASPLFPFIIWGKFFTSESFTHLFSCIFWSCWVKSFSPLLFGCRTSQRSFVSFFWDLDIQYHDSVGRG